MHMVAKSNSTEGFVRQMNSFNSRVLPFSSLVLNAIWNHVFVLLMVTYMSLNEMFILFFQKNMVSIDMFYFCYANEDISCLQTAFFIIQSDFFLDLFLNGHSCNLKVKQFCKIYYKASSPFHNHLCPSPQLSFAPRHKYFRLVSLLGFELYH